MARFFRRLIRSVAELFRCTVHVLKNAIYWSLNAMSLLSKIVVVLKRAVANLAKAQAGIDAILAGQKEDRESFKAFLEGPFAELNTRVGAVEETNVAQDAADVAIRESAAAADTRIAGTEKAIADSAAETADALKLLEEVEEVEVETPAE